jgi:hypothetical protein
MADDTPGDELTLEPTATATRPRRRALWGALAAVAVAAGALAVTSGGGEDERPVLPVALGATGGRDSAAGGAAPTSADLRIGWITYVAGDGLPALGGEGTAYRLDGSVDEARVRALADELGLEGDVTHQDRYWHLEGADGVLEVYDDGGGSWWYSQSVGDTASGSSSGGGSAGCEGGPAVDCAVDTPLTVDPATTIPADECAKLGGDCATTPDTAACGPNAECIDPMPPECAPDTGCVAPPPIEPTPPADLPTKEAAREIALDLLTATGMDVEGAKVTVDGPYDAWYVTVEPVLDGLPVSGWMASVGVGSKGVVTSASGTFAEPESLGTYPLIDTRAAIDRLNEQQGQWAPYPMPLGVADDTPVADDASSAGGAAEGSCSTQPDGSEVCSSTGTAVACAEAAEPRASDGGAATTIVTPCPAPEPTPVDPEPIEVTLTDAERILVLLPSLDGSGDAYLLPGYRFSGADGAMAEVAAVADESLAPTTTVPSTDPTDTTTCEVLVEDDGSGTTHTVNPCPEEIQPSQPDLTHLSEGEQPQVGVAYYVDLTVMTGHCSWVTAQVGDRWWIAQLSNEELASWSTPTEGGSFTLTDADHATFVGDAAGTKVADLVPTANDGASAPGCA